MGHHGVPWARLRVDACAVCSGSHPGVRRWRARRRVSSFEELWLVSRPVIPVSAPGRARERSPLPPGSAWPVACFLPCWLSCWAGVAARFWAALP